MANKVQENLIIPYRWIDSMCTDLYGNYNEELGRDILWYYSISAKDIIEGKGSQIYSDNPLVDMAVKNYLDQLEVMQAKSIEIHSGYKGKRNGMSKEEVNKIIEEKAREGMLAREIQEYLRDTYGINYKDVSTILKNEGWKRVQREKK